MLRMSGIQRSPSPTRIAVDACPTTTSCRSDAFGRSYVLQSDAIWIISQGVVADDVKRGQLALLPVDTTETLGPVGFTTRADSTHSLATSALMQAVRDVAHHERETA